MFKSRYPLLLGLLFMSIVTAAQNLKVQQFRLLENDMTANSYGTQKLDQNGEKAALIKIQAPERGFTFDGGSLGIVAQEEHNGEIWLYVPRSARRLTINHKDYGVLRDYYYDIPIEGARTYEMYIDLGIGRYVTLTSQIAGSVIYIDGENCGVSPINHKYLNYGRHTVRALKDRYEGEQTFVITTDDAKEMKLINIEQRDMSDHFGDVTITVDNNADIYYEGRKVGSGTWNTQLREGNYTVVTRKADCDSAKTTFSVLPLQKNNIRVNAPTPHTGWLSIYTRPGNVKTTYNGDHFIDLSETVSVPIGTYQMEFSRKGYVTQNHEYLVKHNETTVDTVTLKRINYIKPTQFYFGAAFTVRSLVGVTGIIGGTYKNHDLQASYTIGLSETKKTYWSDAEGNYLGSATHKMNSFAIKYGYQISLMERLSLFPQVGYALNMITSSKVDGSKEYGDGATASCVTIGAKVMYTPVHHFNLFVAPEYDIALSKSNDYSAVASKASFDVSSFLMNIGLLVNF